MLNLYIIPIASICTVFGLALYVYAGRKHAKHIYTYIIISWLFIPIFPLVFILVNFPGSTTSGNLLNFQITGAFASYVLLWYAGVRLTLKGVRIDQLNAQIADLEEKCTYVEVINKITKGAAPQYLREINTYFYRIQKTKNKSIALITGDLANIKKIDIWVNSENTNMQMARFGETSISSIIRYLGAKKNPQTQMVIEDTIADQLRKKLDGISEVAPATVVVTDSGELKETNGVQKIFHVASVHGLPLSGYKPISRIQDCVKNCLEKTDVLKKEENITCRTILFSLMGTGTAKGNLDDIVLKLINAAITYLEQNKNTTCLSTVYFLAYTDRDLAACKKVLLESDKVEYLKR
ncbi:hypothetical protein EH223_15565 [candidate division KSB1 bacterium]|nr:hypothetical protein [candidate division KSB1 bacterium]RQW01334.1 MAG: hypothetical protein EH223_15565 [candidate division KSB1 bacterium]